VVRIDDVVADPELALLRFDLEIDVRVLGVFVLYC
jgi:hypothetical protein